MKFDYDFSEWTDFGKRLSNSATYGKYMKEATREIAKVLHQMLIQMTPVRYGELVRGWKIGENYRYIVEDNGDSFSVTIVNRVEYATWVNDGHSQRPGRFIPGYWAGNDFIYVPNYPGGMVLKKSWVKGRFFVEKSILRVGNGAEINEIIERALDKWWKEVY